jgi:hypothetical protein
MRLLNFAMICLKCNYTNSQSLASYVKIYIGKHIQDQTPFRICEDEKQFDLDNNT